MSRRKDNDKINGDYNRLVEQAHELWGEYIKPIRCGNKSKVKINQQYNELMVVTRIANKLPRNHSMYACICECGILIDVNGYALTSGAQKSCGCAQRKSVSKDNPFSNHILYQTWTNIKNRCFNPNNPSYNIYGGRGITVCKSWINSFETFLRDMGECPEEHVIERINSDGNYEPSNCKWTYVPPITSESVRSEFAKEGCKIPYYWDYVNSYTKIPFTCSEGHEHFIIWNSWNNGTRCVWCSRASANLKNYKPDENLNLYWIKIYDWMHGKWCYKFGITKTDISVRFTQSMKEYRFRIKHMRQTTAIASQICMLEQSLLYSVRDYRAKWVPSDFGGYTECFDCSESEALNIWNEVVNGW